MDNFDDKSLEALLDRYKIEEVSDRFLKQVMDVSKVAQPKTFSGATILTFLRYDLGIHKPALMAASLLIAGFASGFVMSAFSAKHVTLPSYASVLYQQPSIL